MVSAGVVSTQERLGMSLYEFVYGGGWETASDDLRLNYILDAAEILAAHPHLAPYSERKEKLVNASDRVTSALVNRFGSMEGFYARAKANELTDTDVLTVAYDSQPEGWYGK